MAKSKKKKKNTVLGLDLGTASIKAVEMMRNGDELAVTSCAYEEVEGPAYYEDSIRSVIEAGALSTKKVVIGFSGRSTLLQTLSIPSDRADDLEDAILEEAEKYIPYDIAEAQVDYHVLADDPMDRQMKVLLAAVRQSDVEDKLEILFNAGINPMQIDVELVALTNAVELANMDGYFTPTGNPLAMADFGASKTLITVSDGNTHVFREFPVGGIALTEMIAQRLGCSMEHAEGVKRDPGDDIDTIKDAIYPGIEDITAEIRSCLDQFKGQSNGREAGILLLSGGLVGFSGVTPLIGKLVRVETRIFDSFGSVDASDLDEEFIGEHAHEFSVAFGLASHAQE